MPKEFYFFIYCKIILNKLKIIIKIDQFSQHHLLKRLSLLECIFLPPLSKIRSPYVCGFISGLSILFHWSICLSLCQYHTVLMTVALYIVWSQEIDSSSSILLSQGCFGYLSFVLFCFCISRQIVKLFVPLLWKIPLVAW